MEVKMKNIKVVAAIMIENNKKFLSWGRLCVGEAFTLD